VTISPRVTANHHGPGHAWERFAGAPAASLLRFRTAITYAVVGHRQICGRLADARPKRPEYLNSHHCTTRKATRRLIVSFPRPAVSSMT
jgi:hypothetical protein